MVGSSKNFTKINTGLGLFSFADCRLIQVRIQMSHFLLRLLGLEKKIVLGSGETPPAVWDMKKKIECLREKVTQK